MNFFHERLKKVMKEQKIGQCELARRLGIKQPTVWEWLNINYPSLDRFYQICCTLKVSPNYLLGLDESSNMDN